MGVLDKFLNAIKLNDEDDEYLDDEYLDDEEDFLDDDIPEEKPRRRFLEKFGSKKDTAKDDGFDEEYDELDDLEDDLEEEPEIVRHRTTAPVSEKNHGTSSLVKKSKPAPAPRQNAASRSGNPVKEERPSRQTSSKITPMRRSHRSEERAMEVCVIRPLSMENTREIADTLIDNSTVILNLEGIDVELAQRIIDFASGACYSLNGSLQKVSSYIFVLGPSNVDITGDMQNILGGSAPSVRAGY